MRVIDKIVNYFDPVKGVQRTYARQVQKVINTGYSDGGASHSKNSLKGFTASSASPLYDIDANLKTLRSRSRSLYMTSPLSRSAISTIRTNVVGGGLKLKARIDNEVLGISEEEAQKIEAQIEREFDLWADTVQCDALGVNNFYEQQALFLLGQLMSGDGLALRKYEDPTPNMPYGLRIQLVESDRLCTPNISTYWANGYPTIDYGVNPNTGNEIFSGIEIDRNGKAVAYHICNQYPSAPTIGKFQELEWTRVEVYGEGTGLRNILHMFDAERAEQRRGVPILAPVIESLKQLSRYSDAELMAAVVSGMFTVFIKTETPSEMPFGEAMSDDLEPIDHSENDYQMGNGAINVLGTNESIQIADPKRPNAAFEPFVDAMCKQIGSSLEIPKELLLKEFNSSYSASRAALLEAWKMFKRRRELLTNAFCQPIYEMFLTEAVARGRIRLKGFFNDPIIRKAYCGADWNGPAAGMIDPVKEVNAAILRVNEGFSTREEETMGLTGGNYIKNVKQLKKENELLQEAKSSMEVANADVKELDRKGVADDDDDKNDE